MNQTPNKSQKRQGILFSVSVSVFYSHLLFTLIRNKNIEKITSIVRIFNRMHLTLFTLLVFSCYVVVFPIRLFPLTPSFGVSDDMLMSCKVNFSTPVQNLTEVISLLKFIRNNNNRSYLLILYFYAPVLIPMLSLGCLWTNETIVGFRD